MPQYSSFARFLAGALVVATLCNGASFYLRRTGVVDYAAYRAYWSHHCVPGDAGYEPQCQVLTSPQEIARAEAETDAPPPDRAQYVYQSSLLERPLKLIKDFVALALLVGSAWILRRRVDERPALKEIAPVAALPCYAALACLASIAVNGPMIAAAGLRWFALLLTPLLGRWLVPHVAVFAASAGLLLGLEALLVPFELVRGIHLFQDILPFGLAARIAGTMVQPNSMGVFAVCALAFCYSFSRSRTWLPLTAAFAASLVALSQSGTGIVCGVLVALAGIWRKVSPPFRPHALALGAVFLGLVLFSLPTISGRGDVFESILGSRGRLMALDSALFDRPVFEVLFGSGLGVGTNTALNLAGLHGLNLTGASQPIQSLPTDSTVTGMVLQLGLTGLILFYTMLLWAGRRDPVARPFYAVIAVCSLTINITELFPINALLGIALVHSAYNPQCEDVRTSDP